MATIKSYTDLEQSKKLAEILPLESADMMHDRLIVIPFNDGSLTPCWSLAALLKLIPSYIIQGEVYFGILDLNECCLKYQTNDGVDLLETKYYDDYIDAAFEMVVWLKENNKL